jgi:hypothetical protein
MFKRVVFIVFTISMALAALAWASMAAQANRADPALIPLCHDTHEGMSEPILWSDKPQAPEWELLELSSDGVAFHLANHPRDFVVDELGTLTPETWDDTCPPYPGWKIEPRAWLPRAALAPFEPTPGYITPTGPVSDYQ